MLKSMTAFGRARRMSSDGALDITAEIRSVNSRYLDCTVRLSRLYAHLEDRVKAYLSEAGVTRGKVEVYVGVDVLPPPLHLLVSFIGCSHPRPSTPPSAV